MCGRQVHSSLHMLFVLYISYNISTIHLYLTFLITYQQYMSHFKDQTAGVRTDTFDRLLCNDHCLQSWTDSAVLFALYMVCVIARSGCSSLSFMMSKLCFVAQYV